MGGYQAVNQQVSQLQNAGNNCQQVISDIYKRIEAEKKDDANMKAKYKEKWLRVNSDVANQDNLQALKGNFLIQFSNLYNRAIW
jgi:hypothetical protein